MLRSCVSFAAGLVLSGYVIAQILTAAQASPTVDALLKNDADARRAGLDFKKSEVYRRPGQGTTFRDIVRDFFGVDTIERSYAVLIGVSDYDDPIADLKTTKPNIKRVRKQLINHEHFDVVISLEDHRASKKRIGYLMEDVLPSLVSANDRVMFYFSGHGTQRQVFDSAGGIQGYLQLSRSGRFYSEMISMNQITRWNGNLAAKQVLFVLDSCFSGAAGVQVQSPAEQGASKERLAGKSRYLITAGKADQETIASDRWGGSIFTNAFVNGIAGAADSAQSGFPKDGIVSLSELKIYIEQFVDEQRRLLTNWSKPITPQLHKLSAESDGEFFFVAAREKIRRQTVQQSPGSSLEPNVEPMGPTGTSERVQTPTVGQWGKTYSSSYEPRRDLGGGAIPQGTLGKVNLRGTDLLHDTDGFVALVSEGAAPFISAPSGWVIALAHNGGERWRTQLASPFKFKPQSLAKAPDGYMVAGNIKSKTPRSKTPFGSQDIVVIALDRNGRERVRRYFGSRDLDSVDAIVPMPTGGYVLGGLSWGTPGKGRGNLWLIRVSESLEEIWSRRFEEIDASNRIVLHVQPDATILVAGRESTDHAQGGEKYKARDGIVMSVSSDGKKRWHRSYPGTAEILEICPSFDGGLFLSTFGHGGAQLIKTDSHANPLWSRKIPEIDDHDTYATTLVPLGRDGIFIAGHRSRKSSAGFSGWAIGFTSQGEQRWSQIYEGKKFAFAARTSRNEIVALTNGYNSISLRTMSSEGVLNEGPDAVTLSTYRHPVSQ